MDQKQKAAIKRYIGLAAAVLVTAGLAAMPMLTAQTLESDKASILTATAQRGDISQVLMGGGPLEAEKAASVMVPEGVQVTEFLVSGGDVVSAGESIAKVDSVSVMTSVVEAQKSLDRVGEKLRTASNKIKPGVITVDEEGNVLSDGKAIPSDKMADYAAYFDLSQQHRDLEQALLSLFRLSQSGTVTAEADGMIADLDKSVLKKLSGSGEGEMMLLGLNTPDGQEDDGITYQMYLAVVDSIGAADGRWNLLTDPTSYQELADFAALPEAPASIGLMKVPMSHKPTAVFSKTEAGWETVSSLKSGDILLLAYEKDTTVSPEDETFVEWVIKIGEAGDRSQPGNTPTIPGNLGGIPGLDNLPGDLSGLLGGSESQGSLDLGALAGSFGGMSGLGGFSGFGSRGEAQEEPLYSTEGIKLCTILPQKTMSLTISVDEADIGKLSTGMTADITLDALPGQTFTGEVTAVSQFGTWNGGSSKFSVTLALPYSEGMLPGMNASAALCLNTLENVVTLPVAALNEQSGMIFVYTGYDPKQEQLLLPVPVTTGLSDGEFVEIQSGLEENMPVFYSYYDKVEISNLAE